MQKNSKGNIIDNCIVYKINNFIYFKSKSLPSKWIVLFRLGVKTNTFAGDIVSRLYDFYFKEAIDLCLEYRLYYKKEFKSFIEYIEQHHNIEHDLAIYLSKGHFSIKRCSDDSIDSYINILNESKSISEAFSKAVGGIKDEDSDGFYYE